MESAINDLLIRVVACEQENRRLRKVIRRQSFAWIASLLFAAIGTATASIAIRNEVFGTIQASEITVVDQKGVVRARISGDMPDAIMYGGRVAKRGAQAAGFMIYDQDGIERGGYVTFDNGNAMVSLDSKYHMVTNMIAGPGESGTAVLNLRSQEHSMELRSDEDAARLSISKGAVVTQQIPAIEVLSASTCNHWREIEKQNPNQSLCRSRYIDAACKRCLDE